MYSGGCSGITGVCGSGGDGGCLVVDIGGFDVGGYDIAVVDGGRGGCCCL